MRFLSQMVFFIFARLRVSGTGRVPVAGGVLLVSNHQSMLDPVLVTLALPRECHYMARDTLFANRWFRALIESLNAFPVKRDTADLGAIREILRRLRDGGLVVTFPEGTRTADGSIGPLRPGSMLVAQRARCTVVPAVIDGAFEAWPRTARLPHPRPIRVLYGAPIPPDQVAARSPEALASQVHESMVALQRRLRRSTRRPGRARNRSAATRGLADRAPAARMPPVQRH